MNAQLKRHPCLRLLDVTQAFAAFCGKPLKALDAGECLNDADLTAMENGLRRMAGYLSKLNVKDERARASIAGLVDEIRRNVGAFVTMEGQQARAPILVLDGGRASPPATDAELLSKLEEAEQDLNEYLIDETSEVFEEIPAVDGARSILIDAIDVLRARVQS